MTRKLYEKPVTFDNLEFMRQLYNENIADLSTVKQLKTVSLNEQMSWWMVNRPWRQAWLHYPTCPTLNGTRPVAFSMLTNRGSFYTPIFAIHKPDQGKGYAREIIEHYLRNAWGPLAGSQRQDNQIICRLNKEFGWKIWGIRKGVDLLYHPGLIPQYPIRVNDILAHHNLTKEPRPLRDDYPEGVGLYFNENVRAAASQRKPRQNQSYPRATVLRDPTCGTNVGNK